MMKMKTLRAVGIAEGLSFLVLLLVAMPLKYMLDMHRAVLYAGMAHGVLFVAFLVVLLGACNRYRWPVLVFAAGVVAAILPLGTFVFDRQLQKYHARHKAAALAAYRHRLKKGRPSGLHSGRSRQ